jgi:hypothetical protein
MKKPLSKFLTITGVVFHLILLGFLLLLANSPSDNSILIWVIIFLLTWIPIIALGGLVLLWLYAIFFKKIEKATKVIVVSWIIVGVILLISTYFQYSYYNNLFNILDEFRSIRDQALTKFVIHLAWICIYSLVTFIYFFTNFVPQKIRSYLAHKITWKKVIIFTVALIFLLLLIKSLAFYKSFSETNTCIFDNQCILVKEDCFSGCQGEDILRIRSTNRAYEDVPNWDCVVDGPIQCEDQTLIAKCEKFKCVKSYE